MGVHRLEIIVIDFDGMGAEAAGSAIENAHYPNHCISPWVQKVETREIGEWEDGNLLNRASTRNAELERLFNQ